MKQAIKYCNKCKDKMPHLVHRVNHILHLILSIIFAGLWIPIWILLAINSRTKPTYCMTCNKESKAWRV